MAERKRSKASTTAVWIIIGLLMFGMIGFGAVGLSGTARSVGTVGDKPISVNLYYNALNTELNNAQQQLGRRLSATEIEAFGIENSALARVVRQRAMDQQTADLGISTGDERLRAQIQGLEGFSSLTGGFDRDAYDRYLDRNNISSSDFETMVREENARGILQTAILTGLQPPAAYQDIIVGYLQETRDYSWAKVADEGFSTGVPVPTDDDLVKFHAENPEIFTLPASKDIAYIWLTPDMVSETIDVSDDELRQIYEDRSSEFNQPETRLLDRLVFPDEAAAQAALDSLSSGKTFEDLVTDRGLELGDVSMGDVQPGTLGEAEEVVFGAAEPGVVGPAQTSLGPALFRINAILDAQVQSFEDVKADLLAERQTNEAAEIVSRGVEDIEDLLAGGATIEDVAAETDMQLGQINWHPGVSGGIADYEEFRSVALGVTEDDFPELINLADGGIFAIRMNQANPSAVQPLEDVRDDAVTAWQNAEVAKETRAFAEDIQSRVNDENTLASFGLTERAEEDAVRTEFIEGAPPALVSTVFEMTPGETRIVEDADGVILVRLHTIHKADLETEESQALKSILGARLQQAFQVDVLGAFGASVQADTDINLNQGALQSVNSQFRGLGH